MQPENQPQTPQHIESMQPAPVIGPENVPSIPSIEARPAAPQEAYEQRADAAMAAAGQANTAPQAAPQYAPPPQSQPQPAVQNAVNVPLVAADDDLIEKEWVDKAKDIIKQTSDDPYARTAQVGELQRSYLQKRYGKVIGADVQ